MARSAPQRRRRPSLTPACAHRNGAETSEAGQSLAACRAISFFSSRENVGKEFHGSEMDWRMACHSLSVPLLGHLFREDASDGPPGPGPDKNSTSAELLKSLRLQDHHKQITVHQFLDFAEATMNRHTSQRSAKTPPPPKHHCGSSVRHEAAGLEHQRQRLLPHGRTEVAIRPERGLAGPGGAWCAF